MLVIYSIVMFITVRIQKLLCSNFPSFIFLLSVEKGGDHRSQTCPDNQEESGKEIMALRSARHSVGSPRKEFMKKSTMGPTVATPTSLHFPSLSNLSPLPLLIFPTDSSDVSTVSTTNGGAL
ncbi:hypothetical protein PanWU01x14_083830 [Parasponia andersonii]|uniref:Uncharacterized protein n=1 Tax=Parasponia andersonii TaxID=3476 RepID=A0A2P5D9F2_PARAD|nr:hypothetical protein PanWU01x14_083830 [Parasponia andersonii]